MNRVITKTVIFFCLLIMSTHITSYGQLDDLLKKITGKSTSSNSSLSTETIVAGLKEALQIGTGNAVDVLAVTNGYFGNELVKIMLPAEVKRVEPILRNVGLGSKVDEFILTMNRAAESAAIEAAPIFVDAIKGMTINDALKILNGGDHAATNYFKDKTTSKLTDKFRPIINGSMDKVGVTKVYKELTAGVANNPFIKIGNPDLDAYVTEKALDGLFKVVAQEEEKIRKDSNFQVTDLLKEVFGGGKG